MTELNEYRFEIDRIDQELTRLIEQRFNLARKVADYKKTNGLPVLDTSREEIVIQRNQERLENSNYKDEIAKFYVELMAISRSIQETLLKEE